MVTHYPKDGDPLSPGWSPTIPWSVIHHPMDGHQQSTGWSPPPPGWSLSIPWMVNQYLDDGHIPSPGWSTTNSRMVTPHPQDGQQCPQDGHPPSPGWSTRLGVWPSLFLFNSGLFTRDYTADVISAAIKGGCQVLRCKYYVSIQLLAQELTDINHYLYQNSWE